MTTTIDRPAVTFLSQVLEADAPNPTLCNCDQPPAQHDSFDYVFEDEQVARPYLYVLETFRFLPKFIDTVLFPLGEYRTAALRLGWRRLFVCNSITSSPSTYVQMWRVDNPPPINQLFHALREASGCRSLLEKVSEFRRELLYPMPYDDLAAPTAIDDVMRDRSVAPDTPETILLIARLEVKAGLMRRFVCAKRNVFIPTVVARPLEWKLIAAGSVLGGAAGTVAQCWVLADSNRLLRSMRQLGQDSDYLRCVLSCIQTEEQELYEPRMGR
jgi:hypothetical protein